MYDDFGKSMIKNRQIFSVSRFNQLKYKNMGKSIDQKIKRSLLALNVSSLKRLFSNMNVIEGYIDKKPIFLEWLHTEIEIDNQFRPIGFSQDLISPHQDSVKVWLLSMRALWGDMRLQALDVLNLSEFQQVHFRSTFGAPFDLQWLYLPKSVHGFIPHVSVCWLSDEQLSSISEERWLSGQWCFQVHKAPLSTCIQSAQVVGLDASSVSEEIFLAWCAVLKDAPIQWVAFPSGFTRWEQLPDWSNSLELIQASDCPSLEQNGEWLGKLYNLRCLSLRGSNLTKLPSSIADLSSLEVLDISDSPIREIPSWLKALKRLRILNVASTALDEYPKNISKISNLKQLIIRNQNATRTVEWLKKIQIDNTNINVQRVVEIQQSTLWMLCTQLSYSKEI